MLIINTILNEIGLLDGKAKRERVSDQNDKTGKF